MAPRIVGRAKAALVPSAHEQSTTSIASGPSSSTSKPVNLSRESPIAGSIAPASRATRVGRVIAKPPPMTLDDDDVNGFRQSTAGKSSMRNENRGSRKKGKRKEDPALQFGDTPYDPARPCDYVCTLHESSHDLRTSLCVDSNSSASWHCVLRPSLRSLHGILTRNTLSPRTRLMFRVYVLNVD